MITPRSIARHCTLRKQLVDLGLEAVDIAADGNCFFRAASLSLHRHENNHSNLRELTAKLIEENGSALTAIAEVSPDDMLPMATHIKNLLTPGLAVGEDAAVALADVTQRDVIIHLAYAAPWSYTPSNCLAKFSANTARIFRTRTLYGCYAATLLQFTIGNSNIATCYCYFKRLAPRKPLTVKSNITVLHFNVRSIRSYSKFHEAAADLSIVSTDFILITETWLSPDCVLDHYYLPGYSAFHNIRRDKGGGGASIYARENIPITQLHCDVTPNNAYNVCAVTFGFGRSKTLLMAVYKADWASSSDVKEMCELIDNLISRHDNVIMAGDFNFPAMNWTTTDYSNDSYRDGLFRRVVIEHQLSQVITWPTRDNTTLDLVFLSESLTCSLAAAHPPIAGSDHDAQLIHVDLPSAPHRRRHRRRVDCDSLRSASQPTGRPVVNIQALPHSQRLCSFFSPRCYVTLSTISLITSSIFRRCRLPRHIVLLLRAKKKAWASATRNGNLAAFESASRTARAAIRQHRRNE
jgi:endonuclease/exonuclease/phosphatase (EEP) superfamily protein YafD